MKRLSKLLTDDSGQDLIEYCLLAALIGLASVGSMIGLAAKLNNTFLAVTNVLHANCPPGMSCMHGH